MPRKGEKIVLAAARKDVVLRRALVEIGDKELVEVLEHQENAGESRAATLLSLMADAGYARSSLARLVQIAGYSRRDIVMAFQEYKADIMRVKLARGLPGFADDLVEDSKSVVRTCGKCNGSGSVIRQDSPDAEIEACKACGGKGTIRRVGDADSRKMVLEITGLVKKGGGFGVNINMGAGTAVDSFDSLISRANDLMGGSAPVAASADRVAEENEQ